METGKIINKISNQLRRRSRIVQESVGISGAKGRLLSYILVEGRERNIYQRDIEKEFCLRPSTATEALKALEMEELIERIPDENDGRWKKIVFTSKAEEIRNALQSEIEQTEALLLKGISKEEQRLFLQLAEKMLENLEES